MRINKAAIAALDHWRDRRDLAVRHVVGQRDWEVLHAVDVAEGVGDLQYLPVAYDDEMPRTLAAADVAVCRPGSSTCFELAATGVPAVLVPSPFVTADHQTANARTSPPPARRCSYPTANSTEHGSRLKSMPC